MNKPTGQRTPGYRSESGFTLIEMIIVIIILGILAMIIIPQVTVSTDDAKVSSLKANLTSLRSSIEVYYAQHNMTYPGIKKATDGTTATATADEALAAFSAQLLQYSDATGKVSTTADAAYPYGPYIKNNKLPDNPYKDNTVVCDLTVTDLTAARAADGTTGWKYLPKIGVLFANDNGTSGGVNHSTY